MAGASISPDEAAVFVARADGGYYVYHEWDDRELSTTITLAVAEIASIEPARVADAFPDYLDPDALDDLFAPDRTDGVGTSREGRLEFPLAGFTVTVYSSGQILVIETDSARGQGDHT